LLQFIASTLRIFYQSNDISIRLEHSSSNVENTFVVISKLLTIFFKLRVTIFSAVSQAQHSGLLLFI